MTTKMIADQIEAIRDKSLDSLSRVQKLMNDESMRIARETASLVKVIQTDEATMANVFVKRRELIKTFAEDLLRAEDDISATLTRMHANYKHLADMIRGADRLAAEAPTKEESKEEESIFEPDAPAETGFTSAPADPLPFRRKKARAEDQTEEVSSKGPLSA